MSIDEVEENLNGSVRDQDDAACFFSPNPVLNMEEDGLVENRAGDDSLSSSINEYSFFDEAIIYTRAGSGGQGAGTYKKGMMYYPVIMLDVINIHAHMPVYDLLMYIINM